MDKRYCLKTKIKEIESWNIPQENKNYCLNFIALLIQQERSDKHIKNSIYSFKKFLSNFQKPFKECGFADIEELMNLKINSTYREIITIFFNYLYFEKVLSFKLTHYQQKQEIFKNSKVRDVHNIEERYTEWREKVEKGETDINPENLKLILKMLDDFAIGRNTSKEAKQGSRKLGTLLILAKNLEMIDFLIEHKPILDFNEELAFKFSQELRGEKLKGKSGQALGNSSHNYLKDLKTFFSWAKTSKLIKENPFEQVPNPKPITNWVYLDEEKLQLLKESTKDEMQLFVSLAWDSGARESELLNLRVCDFTDDFTKMNIRKETSKNGYERVLTIQFSQELIKKHIKHNFLDGEDFLFKTMASNLREQLKRKVIDLFGYGLSHPRAGGYFQEFKPYDLRHCASCYWLKRYPNYKSLMYKFGWKSESFVEHYSRFLGQTDLKVEDKPQEDITKSLMNQMAELQKQNNFLMQQLLNKKDYNCVGADNKN